MQRHTCSGSVSFVAETLFRLALKGTVALDSVSFVYNVFEHIRTRIMTLDKRLCVTDIYLVSRRDVCVCVAVVRYQVKRGTIE
jgi:hypothetical protein